jgi:hypothetical protein
MSPESLFWRGADHVYVRLALENWTKLPKQGTRAWTSMTQLLESILAQAGCHVHQARHNGSDVYLLLSMTAPASIDSAVAALRRELNDPFWRPFLDPERFAWVGEYHAVSVRPGDTLDSEPLEHPARRWKRQHMESRIERTLEHPWHDARTPADVGLRFVACVCWPTTPEGTRVDLLYEELDAGSKEAAAAAHLNARLKLPGRAPRMESVGWSHDYPLPALVFSLPTRLLAEPPGEVEVWWATNERNLVGTVPCYQPGAVPDALARQSAYGTPLP